MIELLSTLSDARNNIPAWGYKQMMLYQEYKAHFGTKSVLNFFFY